MADITMRHVKKSFGHVDVIKGVDLDIEAALALDPHHQLHDGGGVDDPREAGLLLDLGFAARELRADVLGEFLLDFFHGGCPFSGGEL